MRVHGEGWEVEGLSLTFIFLWHLAIGSRCGTESGGGYLTLTNQKATAVECAKVAENLDALLSKYKFSDADTVVQYFECYSLGRTQILVVKDNQSCGDVSSVRVGMPFRALQRAVSCRAGQTCYACSTIIVLMRSPSIVVPRYFARTTKKGLTKPCPKF